MKERIRSTFTGREKQLVVEAVLGAIAKGNNFTTEHVKDSFFAVQDKVISSTRRVAQDKWPIVERWLLPGVAAYVKLQNMGKKENETVVEGLQRQLREALGENDSLRQQVNGLQAQVMQLQRQISAPKVEVKKKKPTVAIAGLLHCQEQIIKTKHGEAFKLSFITSDQYGNGQHLDRMRNADKVVLMTDFVSHNGLQSSLGDKVMLVKGGMSSLHRSLSDLII